MKLIIFCTYRTSPYSGGARKRVLTIEANTPTNTPNIVDRYNSTTCFLCLEKLRKICFTLPDAVYIANTPTFILVSLTISQQAIQTPVPSLGLNYEAPLSLHTSHLCLNVQ